MREIVKQHPLRPIILKFDQTKKTLDFEAEALQAYYRMHDRSWETKQNLIQHREALLEIDYRTVQLEWELMPIRQQLDFLEAAFKFVDSPELPEVEEPFSIDIHDFYATVDEHNAALIELHKDVIPEMDWFNEWGDYIYENENWFDAQDDEGSQLIHKVFSHYDEVSVDIISLDRDQQEFFGELSVIRELQRDYFNYGEEVSAQYNRVHAEAEETYLRALKIKEHVDRNFPA